MQKIFKRNKRMTFVRAGIVICLFHLIAFFVVCQEIDEDRHKIRTVVIDAGHGGKDSGAVGEFSKEKDIVLTIALLAGKYIEEKIPDVKVIYTRTTDVFIPLHERAKIANDSSADLFISIHANSNPNRNPFGTETFAMGLHKTDNNLEVAKKENSVIVYEEDYEAKYEGFDPNDIESYIMISLMQDTYLEQSLTAASFVQNQFRERAKRKDRGVKQAGFLVLWQTSMPSILIETGFLSNKNEEKYLASKQGQDYLASAIFRAFRDYKTYIEGEAPEKVLQKKEVPPSIPTVNKQQETSPPSGVPDTVKKSEKVTPQETEVTQNNTERSKTVHLTDSNIVFKVQILYSENKVDLNDKIFIDFNDVQEINANGKYKYVVGAKTNYSDAIEYSKWVKSRHPDAFVVAISKGKIIPLSEALEIIKTN